MRLAAATLDRLGPEVARFAYDRAAQAVGILHFGLGAFHRAHQAWYTDLAMSGGERDWAITGVSLRSGAVAEQLNPQDGLYTLTERGGGSHSTRLIGAVREVLVADRSAHRIATSLIAPQTRLVSFTVTEKGYCRAQDGSLDLTAARTGFYPLLADAFRERRRAGAGGLTLLSCDNLYRPLVAVAVKSSMTLAASRLVKSYRPTWRFSTSATRCSSWTVDSR